MTDGSAAAGSCHDSAGLNLSRRLSFGSVLGSCEWSGNVLTFTFDHYELGPLRLPVPPKPKTYEFVYVDDQVGGGDQCASLLMQGWLYGDDAESSRPLAATMSDAEALVLLL